MHTLDRPASFTNPNPGYNFLPAFLYDADTSQPGYDNIPVCINNLSPPNPTTSTTPTETFWWPSTNVQDAFCYWDFSANRRYVYQYFDSNPVPFACYSTQQQVKGTYYWYPVTTNTDYPVINGLYLLNSTIAGLNAFTDATLGIAYLENNGVISDYHNSALRYCQNNGVNNVQNPGSTLAWITHRTMASQGWALVQATVQSCGINAATQQSQVTIAISIAPHFQITQSNYQSSLLIFCPTQWFSASNCVAPQTILPTICQLNCRRYANQDCNLAGTKCICKKPYWPIFDQAGVSIISCYLPTIVTTQSSINLVGSIYNSRTFGRQGNCLIDPTNPVYSFCRGVSANFYQDVCFNRGYALLSQQTFITYSSGFPFTNYLNTALLYDCWCDAGYTGSRCESTCDRSSIYESCYAGSSEGSSPAQARSNCQAYGMQRVENYGSYCVASDPARRLVSLNLWNKLAGNTIALNTGFDAQWFRFATNYYGDGVVYAQSRCYIDPTLSGLAFYTHYPPPGSTVQSTNPNSPWFTTTNDIKTVCEFAFRSNGVTSRTISGLRLNYYYLDSNNINCNTANSNNNAFITAPWDNVQNPCLINSDPRPNAADPKILNTNDAGMSANVFWTSIFSESLSLSNLRPIVQCPDQNQWNNNGVCTSCNPACDTTFSFCNPNGVCQCQTDAYFNSTLSICLPKFCPVGVFGTYCDQLCSPCGLNATCDDNIFGSGQCLCNNASLNFISSNLQCTVAGCGPNNACSNNGVCTAGYAYNYCSCNRGWDGLYCQNSRLALGYVNQANHITFDECDCSILWSYQGTVDSVNKLPAGYAILQDYSTASVPLNKSVIGNGYRLVGNVDQAKHLCYKDAMCSGFILYLVPNYWTSTKQFTTDATRNVYQAIFLMQTGSNTPSSVTWPLNQRTNFYSIDRFSLYACPSFNLDLVNWYRTQYFTNVQSYCQTLIAAYNTKHPQQPLNQDISCYTNDAFISHWRYVGHLARLSPNQQCQLSPTIQDPASYCSMSRCPRGLGNLPCSGNGFCLPNFSVNATSPYQCVCKTFYDENDVGLLSLNDIPAWQGSACQYSVAYFCVAPSTSTLCSDTPNACQSAPVASGNFYADQFQNALSPTEVVPQCICDGTSKTGQYCQYSKCGLTSAGCKSLSAAAGDCVPVANSTYACVCQRGAIGKYCEIDATGCLYNDLKCSSQGTCVITNNDPDQPTHCECNPGFSGQFCQNSACDLATMIPGHGICINNQIQSCYGPYSGARCEVDTCAAYNGTVLLDANNLPTVCQCPKPLNNTMNNAIVATCWPQCPIYQKQMCGSTPTGIQHTCIQRQDQNGIRTAKCQCANGYIQIPNPLNPSQMICEKYCFQGTIPVGWTPDNPSPCICSPSTGYDTGQNHPRCDRAICANNGTYSVATKSCQCYPPWINVANCQAHSCGKTSSVIPWYSQTSQSPFQCQCANPTAPSIPSAPFDCNGNRCGPFGSLNPYWSTITNPQRYCICQGKAKTTCDANGFCNYCQNLNCQNGGTIVNGDFPYCDCPFPFINGPLQNCDATVCNMNNTLNATAFGCICKSGYSGSRCDQSFCQNNGFYNITSGTCQCKPYVFGFYCEVNSFDIFANIQLRQAYENFLIQNQNQNQNNTKTNQTLGSTFVPYLIPSSTGSTQIAPVKSSSSVRDDILSMSNMSICCLLSLLMPMLLIF